MAPLIEEQNFVTVRVTEVLNGGSFIAMPCNEDNNNYNVFLADLNNHMNYNIQQKILTPNQKFLNGEICAVYCSLPNEDAKLWYRGRILLQLKRTQGMTVKTLLVDQGVEIYVPGTWLKKLPARFLDFPIQVYSCQFFNLTPLTLAASSESLVAKVKAKTWDTAAKIYLKQLTKGQVCRLQLHYIDPNGKFHVTLFILKDSDTSYEVSETNVNELFVREEYAILENESNSRKGSVTSVTSGASSQCDDKGSESFVKDVDEKLLDLMKKDNTALRMKADEDDLMIELGLPPVRSVKDYENMLPASTDDGVELSDDDSCFTAGSSLGFNRRRKAESERLMSELFDNAETQKVVEPVKEDKPASSVTISAKDADRRPKGIWDSGSAESGIQRADNHVSGDSLNSQPRIHPQRIHPSKDNRSSNPKPAFGRGRSIAKMSDRAIVSADDSSTTTTTSGSERETSSKKSTYSRHRASKETADPRIKRFEEQCLKQQFKDEIEINSFSCAGDSSASSRRTKELAELLSVNAGKKELDLTQDVRDVLVHGNNKPSPFQSVEDLQLPIVLKSALRNYKTRTIIAKPTPIQAHVWPAVLRGRNVVGVDRELSGKKLAYLLPIMLNLLETPLMYKNLPKGTGPIVLILTVDCTRAVSIAETCKRILYQKRHSYRTNVLYSGRGQLDKEVVEMINGCEVLVATVPALLRMLGKQCTNLDRLCHLVFDNADVLAVQCIEEIKDLMKIYASALKNSVQCNLPHQIIAMATKWCYALQSLVSAYFDNPLVVVADKLEATVYKQTKQYIEICSSSQRMDHVIEFLQGQGADQRVVMFTNSAREAEQLQRLLESQTLVAICATEFMTPVELMDIEAAWKASVRSGNCILVLSDKVAPRVTIKDATCVIHYEFPVKKAEFGNRLHCLCESTTLQQGKAADRPECCSLILITEDNEHSSPGIVKLLSRARQHVPPLLKAIAEKVEKRVEETKKSCDICDDLKLLGKCRDIQKCNQRHTVFADSDEPKNLPKSGTVKVRILDVISANVFWSQIVEDPVGFKGMSTAYLKLKYDMQIYYQSAPNRVRHGLAVEGVKNGDICVFKTTKGYQRVRVEMITEIDPQTFLAAEVRLFGIDTAAWSTTRVEKLLVLPGDKCFSLSNVPPQAIELIVCGVKPVDKSYSWTVEACIRIDDMINGKILEGRIVLSLRNTLWLDPLVQKTRLEELNALAVTLHVGSELLNLGFADKNDSHAKNLRELCKDSLPSVVEPFLEKEKKKEKAKREERPEILTDSYETVVLPEDDYQDVYVSAVDHPGLFYVQLMQQCSKLDKMEEKIEAVMKVLPNHEESEVDSLVDGSICLAQFTIDDKWYRAQILSSNEDGECHVFYVDHGDREWISKSRLWKAWDELLELPLQAIECSLVHIKPIGTDWNTEDGDSLWELCKGKLLVAKVKSKMKAEFAGSFKYDIELFDTTGQHDVNMSQELVVLKHAEGLPAFFQEMFCKSLAFENEEKEPLDNLMKIPDICLEIFTTQNARRQIELADSIRQIVMDAECDYTKTSTSGPVKSVTKLLTLCKVPDVQNVLIAVVVYLGFKHERILDEFRREGGLKALCDILKETSEVDTKEQITWALKSLCTNKRNKDAVRIYGGLHTICNLLREDNNEKIIVQCVQVMSVLCLENDLNCLTVSECGGFEFIFELIDASKNERLLEEVTAVLNILLANMKLRNRLREIKGIDILAKFVLSCENTTCLQNVLQALKTATSANQLNRDYMRKTGWIKLLEKLLFVKLRRGLLLRRLCGEVLKRIEEPDNNFTGSGQKNIQVRKIDTNEPPSLLPLDQQSSLFPKTLWSQRHTTITLAIQLRDVSNEVVDFTDNRVYFSCFVSDNKYELDLELYKEIIPSQSTWKAHGGEVVLKIKKAEKCAWPRLHSKTKPPFLICDFDRWVDLTAAKEDDDDMPKYVPNTLPMKESTETEKSKYPDGVPEMYNHTEDSGSEDSSTSSDDEISPNDDLFDVFGALT
eukprot:gene19141-21059_t